MAMDRLFQAFAQAGDGVLLINQQQEIVYCNQAAEAILGYPAREVVGLACYQILKGHDDQGHLACHKYCRVAMTALTGGTVTHYDLHTPTKSGQGRWINMSTFILPTRRGQILVHLFRDVTTNKQKEQFVTQVLAAAHQLASRDLAPSAPAAPVKPPPPTLTGREREVLALLARGFSTRQMAQSLSISPATTRNHLRNILQKLQVHSRLEAVVYAIEEKLITIG